MTDKLNWMQDVLNVESQNLPWFFEKNHKQMTDKLNWMKDVLNVESQNLPWFFEKIINK